jgi:hypothetical protein
MKIRRIEKGKGKKKTEKEEEKEIIKEENKRNE